MLSQKAFCDAFPFHIIFARDMSIRQCGNSIARIVPRLQALRDANGEYTSKLTDIFSIVRPHIAFDFQSICSQIMSVFVLSTNGGVLDYKSDASNNQISAEEKRAGTRFKGQMVYLSDKDLILFQGSPSVMSFDDLYM